MKSVVISGGDGFIGSHLTKKLINAGYEVYDIVIPDSKTKERIRDLQGVHIVEGTLDKYERMMKKLPRKPLAFFHFAWAGVTPDQRTDFSCQLANVDISLNAARLAAELGAEKFVFPGSTMEYVYYGKPIDKNSIPSPSDAYGVAKISAKYACSVLCGELGLPFIYTVISGIYSEDRNDNNVIYYTITKLLNKERPSLTRLEQLWDYVHIDDVVLGLQLIAEKGKNNAFYSIGHGDNWPLSNYIYIIHDLIDSSLPLGIGEISYHNGKLPSSCVDLNSIFQDTGFVPQVSFKEGIARVIDKIKKQKAGG